MLKKWLKKRKRGSILVEFIIIAPIFVIFLAGIYALGQYIDTRMKLVMAARILAQQTAMPKFKDKSDAMYYPYGPEGGMMPGAFGKDITGFFYNINYGWPKMLHKSSFLWKYLDPKSTGMVFKAGRNQGEKAVKKYLEACGMKTDSKHLEIMVRANPHFVATKDVYLPKNNGDIYRDAFHGRPGGAKKNRRKGIASVHPAYWKWGKVEDHQALWVKYPHGMSNEWMGAKVDPMNGEEPKHFDKYGSEQREKYLYDHYTFPVGGWIIIAKVKYKQEIPFAGGLLRLAMHFLNKDVNDSTFDHLWLEGSAAYPAPMSIYDIMDADSALHKAQMTEKSWK